MVLKAHYPIPEIWRSLADRPSADTTAMGLRDAGLSVRVHMGADLDAVPPQAVAESFTFNDDGLALVLEQEDVLLPYDQPLLIVACNPRGAPDEAGTRPPRGSTAVRALPDIDGKGAWGIFADIYVEAGGQVARYGVSAEGTAVSSFPSASISGPAGKLARFLTDCEQRFKRATIDRRLTHLQPRRRHSAPPPGVQRKGFPFGTPALADLLARIAPSMPDMSQCELCSRLVYLTLR
jgi:hypothetical protein